MTTIRISNPICHHVRKGRVQAGEFESGPHVSTIVCDREACIADAIVWAEAKTGLPARHIPDPSKRPTGQQGALL